MPTAAEIQASQGTRLQEKAPWLTYNDSLDQKLSPELQKQVDEYAKNRYEDSKSSQTKEELHRQKEINEGIAKEYQWVHPSEYADAGPRIGRIIHSSELINKLRKMGLRCWYRQHPQPDKITLLVQPSEVLKPEVGCWVQYGFMPEYTIMGFDDKGVPLAERYRGWRTVCLQLQMKGLLNEDHVNKVFGRATGPASTRYLSTLYEWRKRKYE